MHCERFLIISTYKSPKIQTIKYVPCEDDIGVLFINLAQFLFIHLFQGIIGLFEPCGIVSITYVDAHYPYITFDIKVSHFFYVLLRLIYFNVGIDSYTCSEYSAVRILVSSALPWEDDDEDNYLQAYHVCGRLPDTDLLLQSNRVKVVVISKMYINTLEMTFAFTIIDMEVIIMMMSD